MNFHCKCQPRFSWIIECTSRPIDWCTQESRDYKTRSLIDTSLKLNSLETLQQMEHSWEDSLGDTIRPIHSAIHSSQSKEGLLSTWVSKHTGKAWFGWQALLKWKTYPITQFDQTPSKLCLRRGSEKLRMCSANSECAIANIDLPGLWGTFCIRRYGNI